MTRLASGPSRGARPLPEAVPGQFTPTPAPTDFGHGKARGRHATALGEGFGWTVGWSIIGTLLPGSGLLAAGRRATGLLVLGLALFTLSALAVFSLLADPVRMALNFAVDSNKLLLAVAGITLVGLLGVILVLSTYSALRHLAAPSSGQRVLGALLATALVGVVALPTLKLSSYAMIQRDLLNSVFGASPRNADAARPDAAKADPWAGTPRVNVLLIGSDAGADRVGVRPDTTILASINTVTGDTVLFSLPRNLQHVPFVAGSPGAQAFPDGYWCPDQSCLLNAIWTWAEGNPRYYPKSRYPDPGLSATEDAVEGVTGLKVDYYAMLNLRGFSAFVDAIGGITVNVTERLPIGGSVENPHPTGFIEPGKNQHLDGYRALWFARSRLFTDDYDRMRRQRCVIGAIVSQAQPAKVAEAFPRLASAAKANISTDIPQADLSAWVDLSLRVKKGGSVRSLTFTPSVIGTTVNPNFSKIQELVQESLKPPPKPTPAPSASASAGASPAPKPSATPSANPTAAQDVSAVC